VATLARPETGRQEAATTARRGLTRCLLALGLLAGAVGLSPALADTKHDLDAAKAELAQAQGELNQATARLNEAVTRLDATKAEMLATRVRISGIERKLQRIDDRLARRAVVAFTSGPASTIDLLLSSSSFTEFSDRLEFLGSVEQNDVDLSIEQQNAQEDLRRERADLLELSQRQAAQTADLRDAQEEIDAQFQRIQGRVNELTAKYREELAAQKQLTILGQTPDPSSPIQVCPVAGPNSFVDSFGWPRDGHTHQGIDLIAPFGTPIVAAHPGVVSHSSSSSGGIQAYVRASSGTYTFYAHLSSYSSAGGSVGAGTVIGYVGSTGNAGSVNHLHFEYHPGGGAAIDPYQMLLAVC
jgi:murein DD-endopeptidase MepM/ murein hydrolase activator NlpD